MQVKDSHVDTIAIRHKAESILNDLAKNLVALKASEERLSEDARRSYLQVSFALYFQFGLFGLIS